MGLRLKKGRQEAVLFWKKEPKNFCMVGFGLGGGFRPHPEATIPHE
jgi:hypothetical protein